MVDRRVYDCWVILESAEDIPGEWIAHCLNFDLVTQGRSPLHALEMAIEACNMVVIDDLNAGRDPIERAAPHEDWTLLEKIVKEGRLVEGPESALPANAIIAAPIRFEYERHVLKHTTSPSAPMHRMTRPEMRAVC